MGTLRLLLIVALALGVGSTVVFAPWSALQSSPAMERAYKNAPLWAPPEPPPREFFGLPTPNYEGEAEIFVAVALDRKAFFWRFASSVVLSFFAFGVIGFCLERKGRLSTDVGFSLAMSSGIIGGALVSLTCWQMTGAIDPPYFTTLCTVGFVIGLIINHRERRRIRALD